MVVETFGFSLSRLIFRVSANGGKQKQNQPCFRGNTSDPEVVGARRFGGFAGKLPSARTQVNKWVWLKIKQEGLRRLGPCFRLPGFHFGTGFFSRSQVSCQDELGWLADLLAPQAGSR